MLCLCFGLLSSFREPSALRQRMVVVDRACDRQVYFGTAGDVARMSTASTARVVRAVPRNGGVLDAIFELADRKEFARYQHYVYLEPDDLFSQVMKTQQFE